MLWVQVPSSPVVVFYICYLWVIMCTKLEYDIYTWYEQMLSMNAIIPYNAKLNYMDNRGRVRLYPNHRSNK